MTSSSWLPLSSCFLFPDHLRLSVSDSVLFQAQTKMHPGLISSSTVSEAVQPTTAMSTISTSHRLPTLTPPLFYRLGRSTCDGPLSFLTGNGFYTSRIPLCAHTPGESGIILGSNWVFAIGAIFCNGGSGILNPSQSFIVSLPEGRHWSPDEGETALYHGVAAR